jgi:hypothetical protein
MAKKQTNPESVPKNMQAYYDALIGLTDAFCARHLNAEYAELCRKMAAALCRKRPSPVTRGVLNGWAAGIVHAIGGTNFLFDPSQKPHMTAIDISAGFGVSPSTGAAKAKQIRDMFHLGPFKFDWLLPSRRDQNPLAWIISVNGLVMDVRHAPRPIQEEALRKGLIPSLPDDLDSEGHV